VNLKHFCSLAEIATRYR